MDHIGIDLGGRDSQVCVRNSCGGDRRRMAVETDGLIAFLQDRPPAPGVWRRAPRPFAWRRRATAGHDVRVVAATLVRSLGLANAG